jgi:Uma2 family endonuclease
MSLSASPATLEATQLIVMTPTGSETGARNSRIEMRLPDDSVLSPDASLVRLDRWQALTPEQRRGFATEV